MSLKRLVALDAYRVGFIHPTVFRLLARRYELSNDTVYMYAERGVYIMHVKVRRRCVYIHMRLTHSSKGGGRAAGAVYGL